MKSQLHGILNAKSIAIIGASNDPKKRGYQAIKQLLSDRYMGQIFPINPKAPEILGLKAHASILDVEDPIDVVLVCTPAKTLPSIMQQCGEKGIGGAVVLAAGFDDETAEASLQAARENNVRIIGPNTNGAFNLHNRMNLVGVKDAEKGHIGIVSQSGNMSLAFITEAKRRGGVGFSTYVGVGNQLDVRFNEYLEYFGEDENTQVPLMYIEGFKNGGRFLEVCRNVSKEKPVVIYKSGRTEAGATAASSHTGSLASSFGLTKGVLKQAGAVVIEQSDKVLSVAEGLSKLPAPKGGRVAVLADGGGHATITIDALVDAGVELADLSEATLAKLGSRLPPAAALSNPVDVAGGTDDDPSCFSDCARILLEDEGVDLLMIVGMFGGYAARFSDDLLNAEIEASLTIGALARRFGKPLVVQSVYGTLKTKPLEVLKETGVPLFIWPEPAVRCVASLIEYSKARDRILNSPRIKPGPVSDQAKAVLGRVLDEQRSAFFEHEAKDLLRAYDVDVPPHFVARSPEDLSAVTAELGDAPMAMKIISEDILHKSDAGGVKLKVAGDAALRANYDEILKNAKAYKADAAIEGVLVSPMAQSGVEVIIGVIHDETFGPVMMFGLGGIFVEVLKDVSFRALPMSKADAQEMIEEIKSAKMLEGVRGALPVDKVALVDLIMKVSTLALSHPEIKEIDLNPVIVRHDGYDVVDARMIIDSKGH